MPNIEVMKDAIQSLADVGDPDSVKILSLIDRLLADDWHGSGVYEALDAALAAAERKLTPVKQSDGAAD